MYQLPINRRKKPFAVGIDPDLKASGISIWSIKEQKLICSEAITFPMWLDWLTSEDPENYHFYIEAGWLNKTSNYHEVTLPKKMKNASPAEKARYIAAVRVRVGKDVGQNHATGKLMVEVLKHFGFSYELVQPKSEKWSPQDYTYFTGFKTNNQDVIDSAKLVVGK